VEALTSSDPRSIATGIVFSTRVAVAAPPPSPTRGALTTSLSEASRRRLRRVHRVGDERRLVGARPTSGCASSPSTPAS
jgi:hypothetical protein